MQSKLLDLDKMFAIIINNWKIQSWLKQWSYSILTYFMPIISYTKQVSIMTQPWLQTWNIMQILLETFLVCFWLVFCSYWQQNGEEGGITAKKKEGVDKKVAKQSALSTQKTRNFFPVMTWIKKLTSYCWWFLNWGVFIPEVYNNS